MLIYPPTHEQVRRNLERTYDRFKTALKQINHLVAKALMSLMTVCDNIDKYRDWAKQLSFLLDDLVSNSEFAKLMVIYDYFVREEKYQTDPDRSKIVSLILKRFEGAQFITKIVTVVDQPTGSVAPGTMPFLIRLGEPVIGEILDRMAADQILNSESALYHILEQTPADPSVTASCPIRPVAARQWCRKNHVHNSYYRSGIDPLVRSPGGSGRFSRTQFLGHHSGKSAGG